MLVGSSSNFTLVFESQTGATDGIVALDDVSLTSDCLVGGRLLLPGLNDEL